MAPRAPAQLAGMEFFGVRILGLNPESLRKVVVLLLSIWFDSERDTAVEDSRPAPL